MTCFTLSSLDDFLLLFSKKRSFVSESNSEHQWIDTSQLRPIKRNERLFPLPVYKQHVARGKASGSVTGYGEMFVSDVTYQNAKLVVRLGGLFESKEKCNNCGFHLKKWVEQEIKPTTRKVVSVNNKWARNGSNFMSFI